MERHGNKTIMCSVLFLDIVEYSRESVSGQISLKERFNSYLSTAISSVPIADRIILDTGDGAAVNFLGDVEDALNVALCVHKSVLDEDHIIVTPLLVRMGINHGPVRLVRDINGQPNIVGDGINVAQRVMSFSNAGQILVSRSYYDAVSRLSPNYTGMFHYQGSRTDKHVREHEVYAIDYPCDKMAQSTSTDNQTKHHAATSSSEKFGLSLTGSGNLFDRLKLASHGQSALYVGALVISLVLIGALVLKLAHRGETSVLPSASQVQPASGIQPVSAVTSITQAAKIRGVTGSTRPAAKTDIKNPVEGASALIKNVESKTVSTQAVANTDMKKGYASRDFDDVSIQSKDTQAVAKSDINKSIGSKTDSNKVVNQNVSTDTLNAYMSISCDEGTKLFVDGDAKGKVVTTGLVVTIPPGKHEITVLSQNGTLFTQFFDFKPGKTIGVRPVFCAEK